MQDDKTSFEILRKNCSDNSFQCFGYEYLFDQRASRFGSWLSSLKVFGIVVPALAGAYVIGYGLTPTLKFLIYVAGIISIVQFIFSIFAVIYKWDDELSYAYEASPDYNNLHSKFKDLAQIPPNTLEQFKKEYNLLDQQYRSRSQQDAKHNIADWERRKAMRSTLREHQKECVGCYHTPVSMESTQCDVCGKFSFNYKYKLLQL
jgi:mobilome CxxCx(11)CxxC protein